MEIVVLDWATIATEGIDLAPIQELGNVRYYDLTPPQLVAERIGDAQAILINKVQITSDIMKKCPNLKYIGLFATGYNNVDVDFATKNGITVCNAGSYSTNAVSQHTFAMIMHFYNKISLFDSDVKDELWCESPTFCLHKLTNELSEKTISIIGFGNIGKSIAKIADAFNMNVLVATRTIPKDSPYTFVTIDEALEMGDIVTIHCPLTDETSGLICRENLNKMKKSALLVNTSRGGVIVENDLADALNDGTIAGAALDVLEIEPMSYDTPLKNAKNCLITPHVAWAAIETRKRLLNIVADNLQCFINGQPKNKVN